MPYPPPERLEVPGLVVRRERPADAALVAAVVARNLAHLAPWMPWATPEAGTVDVQRERLVSGLARWDAGEEHGYLLLAPDDVLRGIVGLHRRIGPGAAEIGYWLAADAVGRGYVTAAVEALTVAALALPDVDRVEIHCAAANARSAAVARRLGYRLDRTEDRPAETEPGQVWVTP